MQYLKLYEEFFWNRKKDDRPQWQKLFSEILEEYKKIKLNKSDSMIDSNVKEYGFDISIHDRKGISLWFSTKKDKYIVTDMTNVYKSDHDDYEITKGEYEKCKEISQQISDWLDEESERTLNHSDTVIGDQIDFQIDEYDVLMDEINDKLNSEIFKKYISKSYEFELAYSLWTSGSQNSYQCTRHGLKIRNITVQIRQDRTAWMTVYTNDIFGKPSKFFLESTTSSEYHDLSSQSFDFKSKSIRMSRDESLLTRKQKRDKQKSYPSVVFYDITPSKYNSIKFIKELVDLLKEMNELLKINPNR